MNEKLGEVDEEKNKRFLFSLNKKLFYVLIFVLVFFAILLLISFFVRLAKENINDSIPICGDGSFPGTCSLTKPYYCSENGNLIYDATLCDCPKGFLEQESVCASDYEEFSKEINLNYVVGGEENFLDFEVYGILNDYFYSLKQSINYNGNEDFSRADFKLNKMDDEIQREFILPLVVQIQNLASDNKDEQARIAISLVQNIPFGESNKIYNFGNTKINYSRYPYQVLYDYEGICGEKTELMGFLLRELGFGIAFFYYADENHEVLGIKCPVEKSFANTGYCFVETTGPSIISDNEINYADIGKLYSVPKLYFISDGLTFGDKNFYEYSDAKKIQRIRNAIEKRGWIGFFKKRVYEKLQEKYGLVDEYYSG